MVDPAVLKRYGSTQERLKEVLTSIQPENFRELKQEEQEKIERDLCLRKRIEEKIQDRLWESIQFNLRNYQIFGAIDLAWDSTPINKAVYPMILYAQGKLDLGQCATSLQSSGMGKYVTRDTKGVPINVDLPKFYETNINLIRSILTRRLAAQSNKYANLWPFYNYDSRSTSLIGKLRADIMSQLSDIIADGYDYRHHEVQVMRDMLMYGNVVDFIRCSWERDQQIFFQDQPAGLETEEPPLETRVIKEGLAWVNPHPTRTFWDNAYPLPSVNTDSGCEWLGYWDVQRYKDVQLNTAYWNRDKVVYSTNMAGLFTNNTNYFSQYYCTITPPVCQPDLTSANDRLNNIGILAASQGDSSIIVSNFFWKIIPKDWGVGDYPFPVWTRFVVASDRTVQFAEFLPSTPAAVASYNTNDNRQVNISFAHELMGMQDQLTNLLSYLLLCLQADNIKVMIIDSDVAGPEHIKAFKQQMKGDTAYQGTTVLEISRQKMEQLGINGPEKIVQLVETKASQLDIIFRAMGQLLSMVERLAALSPQEQGQPAPREISATETNLIAGTTESVYGFISDSIDEYRAAKKRILYESYMAYGQQTFRTPVIDRYPRHIIEAAGLKAEEGEQEQVTGIVPRSDRYTILGSKRLLVHDFIFTSRDGAERPVNTQAANVLVQMLSSVMQNPAVAGAMSKEQLYGVVNEIFRQSGAGYDLKMEMEPGEENTPLGQPGGEQMGQVTQMIQGLTQAAEGNKQEIEQIKQALGGGGPQGMPSPQQPPQPPPPPEVMPPGMPVAA